MHVSNPPRRQPHSIVPVANLLRPIAEIRALGV
jgi:hypothetical protein